MLPKVLYIEDNPSNLLLIQKVLKFSGYDVSVAESGIQGLRVALQDKPDVILMDINLPDMSGLEVTRRIKAHPELRHIPVIALTTLSDPSDIDKAKLAGCEGFLTKPIVRVELLKTIQQYLKYIHPADV